MAKFGGQMLSISRTLPCPRIVQTCPIRLKRRSTCPWTKSMAVFTERPFQHFQLHIRQGLDSVLAPVHFFHFAGGIHSQGSSLACQLETDLVRCRNETELRKLFVCLNACSTLFNATLVRYLATLLKMSTLLNLNQWNLQTFARKSQCLRGVRAVCRAMSSLSNCLCRDVEQFLLFLLD